MELPRPTKAQILTTIGILFSLAFLIYGRTIDYPFVLWDDGLLIYDNPAIREISLRTLKMIFSTYDPELYIPLTLLSYQFDFLIGGIHPAIYHLQNIIWHAANAALVTWLLYWLLLLRADAHERQRIAWIALGLGALFAVHPLNVETIAWSSARKDLLSSFFALTSLLLYMQWEGAKSKRWYYGSLTLFTFGLLSKVTILFLPAIFLIIDLWSRRRLDKQRFVEKIPFFTLSAIFAEIAIIGKARQIVSVTPMETVLVTCKAILFTIQKWFVPLGLSVLYPYNQSVSISASAFILPFLGLLGFIGFMSFLAIQKRIFTPLLCSLFYFLALAPSLLNFAKEGMINITSDRYAYLAEVGILLGCGMGLLWFLRGGIALRHYRKHVLSGLMFCVLLIAITLSVRQTKTWASSEALFTNVIAHYPDSHVAHNNLGEFLTKRPLNEGKTNDAIAEYEKALQIAENLPHKGRVTDLVTSKILSNLASALRQSGDTVSAKRRYDEALKNNPNNPYAYLGLGIIAAAEGRMGEVEGQYQIALQVSPQFSPAFLNLGALYSATGRYEEAIAALDQGIAIDPFAPQEHYNRAVVLQKMNRLAEARVAYAHAIEIAPSFVAARINLGILEANRGRREEAVNQFQEVLRYSPGNAKATEALRQLRSN